jgi:DeoR/GlpR family transcriptional regulator of sugar metabolism
MYFSQGVLGVFLSYSRHMIVVCVKTDHDRFLSQLQFMHSILGIDAIYLNSGRTSFNTQTDCTVRTICSGKETSLRALHWKYEVPSSKIKTQV